MIAPAESLAMQRLLQLWIILECGLGGLLHVIKLPLTGMLLGTFVVLYCHQSIIHQQQITRGRSVALWRRQVIYAAMTVVAAKVLLTPHAGPGAFIAIAYQVLICLAIFSITSGRIAVIAAAVVIALFTALHKAISYYILLGSSLVAAIEKWSTTLSDAVAVIPSDTPLLPILYVCAMGLWGLCSAALVLHYGPWLVTMIEQAIIPEGAAQDHRTHRRVAWWYTIGMLVLIIAITYTTGNPWVVLRVAALILFYRYILRPIWSSYLRSKVPTSTDRAQTVRDAVSAAPHYYRLLKDSTRRP